MSVLTLSALKAEIDLYIKTNGVKAITGALLNVILNDVVDSLQDYTDDELAVLGSYLLLSGGTMTGDIEMGGNSISSVSTLRLSSTDNRIFIIGDYIQSFDFGLITANRKSTFPDKDITVAGLDDITTAIAALVDTSPTTLDTLNELAAALGDDPNFATTVTNAIAAKLPLSGGVMSGSIELNGNSVKNNTGAVLLESGAGLFNLRSLLSTFIGVLNVGGLTANRTITFQDKDHIVAGLDDIKDNHLIVVSPSSHTGTVVETPVRIIEIPAGRWKNGDFINFLSINEVNTDSCFNRFYINSTPDLTGTPKQLLYYNQTLTVNLQLWGHFYISAGKLEGFKPPTVNSTIVYGHTTGSAPSHTIDFTVTQYLIQTCELAVDTKIFIQKALRITRERQ